MDHPVIESLRIDVQALLQLGQKTIQKIVDQKLLTNTEFDEASAYQTIEVLRGEAIKLEELETVLAVVGTMKAGKSTTINAIVGTEILPNRNTPMTAIPTLIKHTQGQKRPRFIFSEKASQPINQLVQDLKEAFKDKNYQQELEQLKSDYDLYELVEKIRKGTKVVNQALDEHRVIKSLQVINDLVRIAPIFDLKFPFDQYQEIDQLPVIEVEFTHLRELTASTGKLVLLDTAGQNEAGQVHLRPMLQDQLKKASAVLAVMDYTQLKSEADVQVRDDLKTISDIAQDRIYALVNKFDNCDRNGMQESDVKEFVEGLTDGLIQREKVYPVSARFAYLANRARHDCLEDGSLPDIDDARWVEDFYQEAGLRRNRDRIPERIAEGIEDLWEDSKFSHPLKEVIEVAHDKAALIALESALDKLANYTDQLSPVIFALSNSLSIEKQESEKIIIGLKDDLKEIEKLLEKIEIDKNNIVEKFSEKSRKLIENRYSECNELIKDSLWKQIYLSGGGEYDDFDEWYQNDGGKWIEIKFEGSRYNFFGFIEGFLNTTYALLDSIDKKIEKELCDFSRDIWSDFQYGDIFDSLCTLSELIFYFYFDRSGVKVEKDTLWGFRERRYNMFYSDEKDILNKLKEKHRCYINEDGEDNGGWLDHIHIDGSYEINVYELKEVIEEIFINKKKEHDEFTESNIVEPILEGVKRFFDKWKDGVNGLRKEAIEQLDIYQKRLDSSKKNEFNEIQSTMALVNKSTQILKKRLVDIA